MQGGFVSAAIPEGSLATSPSIVSPGKLVSGRFVRIENHDAVMRIGGEVPGGGPILSVGIGATFAYGFPPPRIVSSAVG